MNPRYPVYIVSKGRADSRLTAKALEEMGVPYFIVIEAQDWDAYSAVIDVDKILVLPVANHGNGPGLARNWCWEHSRLLGVRRHWVMDDNINGFYRLNNNLKVQVTTGAIFRAMEDFCDRYLNVHVAGPNYFMFASRKTVMPPFVWNTRIYSCLLIENEIPYRWEGRYNEDTDLSLRILKDGHCTCQFNAFLQYKITTQTLGGGCSAEFYFKEGTLNKSKLLQKMHPDVTEVVWKWGRWHHHVDYSRFKRNKPKRDENVTFNPEENNYGMFLHVDPLYEKKNRKES